MIPVKELKKYSKKMDYTYTLGAFPTFELLENCPRRAEQVIISTQANADIREKAERICASNGIPLLENDRALERIRDKEACILAGVLRKYQDSLQADQDHVVLVNPGDMGNLGTIVRTCVGFGVRNLAVIEPAAELLHPKTIRASMGALFSIHFEHFASFGDYREKYGKDRDCYPFMLKGAISLDQLTRRKREGDHPHGERMSESVEAGGKSFDGLCRKQSERSDSGISQLGKHVAAGETGTASCVPFGREQSRPFALIFGNEATGLDDSFLEVGQSVLIRHSDKIDSLNLSMAVGIALYEFTRGWFSD